MMKIGIMGYYPPPVGGISIHVKRLGELLKLHNIDYKIYSVGAKDYNDQKLQVYTNRRKWAMNYMFSKKEDLIHCHIMGWSEKAFYLLLGKLSGKKVVYTFHSYRDTYETLSGFYKLCFKFVRKFGDGFIAVGKSDMDVFKREGFDLNKVRYIPGFIAPRDSEVLVPDYMQEFLSRHDVNLCGNASNNNFYNDEDLYGIDLCIELTKNLKEQSVSAGFIFFLSNISQMDYYETLRKKIVDDDIVNEFLFVQDSLEFYHIIKLCDLFVRPTNTDGDAISIREALYYGVPALASDVVTRPENCMLFKSRDSKDLRDVTLNILSHRHEVKKKRVDDYGLEVIRFYEDITGYQFLNKERSK